MKEINYKDMTFNPFNLIGDELTNEASAEGKLASTMPCKEEVGDSQWMLVTAGDENSCNTMTARHQNYCINSNLAK